jgi:transposase
MENIKVIGIDLAKNFFQIHATDSKGKGVFRKRIARENLTAFLANLQPALIGMEACGGAHYWARQFQAMGHTVKLMSPQFVKPYVKSNKNDRNDAEAIAEAVTRPNMKFVAVKQLQQQDILLLHRARELLIKQRTAQANQIRGLLAEYGVVVAQGLSRLRKQMHDVLENKSNKLTTIALDIFNRMYEQLIHLDTQIKHYDEKLELIAKQDERCQRLKKIEGVGTLSATAMIATLGDVSIFKNGREVSAWLGLVPKQHSSGNTIRLSGISKRGDSYLRTLLIHGARSVVNHCEKKLDKRHQWLADKKQRCGSNKAAVALANKNARVIWALLASGEKYQPLFAQ